MPLTERVQILISPTLRRQLEDRARAEEKSMGQLTREFMQFCLQLPSRAEKLMAAERLCAMQLPVADWEEMERELEESRYEDCLPDAVLP